MIGRWAARVLGRTPCWCPVFRRSDFFTHPGPAGIIRMEWNTDVQALTGILVVEMEMPNRGTADRKEFLAGRLILRASTVQGAEFQRFFLNI